MTTRKAFTLIELLVVVLIIGILAAVAVPQYQKAVEKARMTEAMILTRSLRDAQARYYLANNTYTEGFDELDIALPGHKGSSNSKLWYLPNGSFVATNSGYSYVRNASGTLSLVLPHQGKTFSGWTGWTCQARQGNALVNQVCKSLGGTTPTDVTDCAVGACTQYKIPL